MITIFEVTIPTYLCIATFAYAIITITCFFLNWTCDKSIDAEFKKKYPRLATFLELYPNTDYIGQMMNRLGDIFCCVCPVVNILMFLIMISTWEKCRDDSVEILHSYAYQEYDRIKRNIKQETGENLDDELLDFMNKTTTKSINNYKIDRSNNHG